MTTLEDWRGVFDRFDVNKDGQISTGELKSMFDALGLQKDMDQVKHVLEEFDANKNGFLDRIEFSALLASLESSLTPEAEMRMAFLVYDVNGDNFLSKEDIRAMIKKLDVDLYNHPDKLDEVFAHVDKDGNGQIDYLEFVEAVKERYFD